MRHDDVPQALRNWFVVHFVADMLFAIPLMIAPEAVFGFFGWKQIDPFASRIVAAALFGIGIQSLAGKDESRDVFKAMLNLKIIWSAMVLVGIAWTVLELDRGNLLIPGILFGIFLFFNLVWVTWRRRLSADA